MLKLFKQSIVLVVLVLVCTNVFAASPRINYLLHCSGCHTPTGVGKMPNVPTLIGEMGRMMSVPEMREYLVRVPGSAQSSLTDAELADVINWVLDEFNAETLPDGFEKLTSEEVTEARRNVLADPLKYRIQFWGNYDN